MLEGTGRRKVRPKERLLLQRVSWLPPWVGVGNSHDARAPAGAPSVRGFENHASLRVRRAIKKIETQRHRASGVKVDMPVGPRRANYRHPSTRLALRDFDVRSINAGCPI